MRRFAIAAALLLSACATATPYQPQDRDGYGFSEQRLENNRFRIEFHGNSVTARAQVEDAMLYRAAELTLQSGYDYFVVVTRGTDKRTQIYADGPYYSPFYTGRFYSRRFGWRPLYDPFYDDPLNYTEVTRYEAEGEIAMYKGAKPAGDAKAFDARQVQQNLAGKVVPPPAPKS